MADNDKISRKGHRTAPRCCRCPFYFVKTQRSAESTMTKKEALSIVFACAPLYKENLVDKSLLFITTDKHKSVHCLEVTFDISNFLHMTGFKLRKPSINARHFFNLCYDKRLTEADFEFSADGTTEMKMRVLPSLMKRISPQNAGRLQYEPAQAVHRQDRSSSAPAWVLSGIAVKDVSFPTRCWRRISEPSKGR